MHNETQDTVLQARQVLVAGKLYTPAEVAGPAAVVLEGTTVRDIWRGTDAAAARHRVAESMPDATVEVTDLGSWCLAPGYIDLHTHGFHGYDVTTGPQKDVEGMVRELPQTGVTSFFPIIATLARVETIPQVQRGIAAAESQEYSAGAEILGVRLEGPFINRAKKGAQYEPGIRPPDPKEMEELAAVGRGWVRIVDYAPEEDEGDRFLATVVRLGILACIDHTAATYEQAIRAIDGGARHSTHLFNAMSALEHREPGVPGALLTDSRVTVEIIADGIHVHPAAIKLALAARGPQDIALITDAVAPAGVPEGDYEFVGRKVTVCEGAVRLAGGALAGSVLTLDRAVRNMVNLVGLGWSEAIRMAALTPALIAGVAARKGSIVPGADADLVPWTSRGSCSAPGSVAALPISLPRSRTNTTPYIEQNGVIQIYGTGHLRSSLMQEHIRSTAQTHMLSEIHEQPAALRRTLTGTADTGRQVALEAQQRDVDLVILAARGTSDHAALYAQYLFQYLNGIPVALATPSLYTLYGASLRLEHALVIGISQSGESPDIVEVVARAREAGALTVGITNQEGSQLATTARHTLLCHAGLERSVAAVPIPLELPTLTHEPAKAARASIAELLAPIPYIIPGQLFAHYLALYKGLNPDQPRSLTKITRTR